MKVAFAFLATLTAAFVLLLVATVAPAQSYYRGGHGYPYGYRSAFFTTPVYAPVTVAVPAPVVLTQPQAFVAPTQVPLDAQALALAQAQAQLALQLQAATSLPTYSGLGFSAGYGVGFSQPVFRVVVPVRHFRR